MIVTSIKELTAILATFSEIRVTAKIYKIQGKVKSVINADEDRYQKLYF